MAAAGGAARIGHFPKGLAEAGELADFERAARSAPVALGTLAGGRQLPRAHQHARVGGQFLEPEFFGSPVGNVEVGVVLREAFGQPGLRPVGRLVNGARVAFRVAEAFGQQRPITVLTCPLADQFPQPRAQALTGQVRPPRCVQDQETPQLHHQFQTPGARHRIPARRGVPRLQMPGRCTPHQHRHQLPLFGHQLTEPVAGFPAGPQSVLASQRRLGLPPLQCRMRFYFQCAQSLNGGLGADIVLLVHQRITSSLQPVV